MQLKEFDILLDIKKRNNTDAFEVVQGDSHSNVVNVTLVDGLDPFDLTDTHIEIVFKKSDGTTVMQNDIILVDAVQGKIQCTLKTNTIASHGKTVSEIRVMESEVLLTSTTFEFYVRKALLNDETIESTNEFPVLTRLINEVRQIEAQVPEEVVGSLNTLESYVNGLAGSGRTNETIKGNADNILQLIGYVGNLENLDTVEKTNIVSALNEIYQNHTTHLADYATFLAGGEVYNAVLLNGWTGNLKYSKNGLGQVHLFGAIIPGTISNKTLISLLPLEYAPKLGAHTFVVRQSFTEKSYVGITIGDDGNLLITDPISSTLENITRGLQINTIYQV